MAATGISTVIFCGVGGAVAGRGGTDMVSFAASSIGSDMTKSCASSSVSSSRSSSTKFPPSCMFATGRSNIASSMSSSSNGSLSRSCAITSSFFASSSSFFLSSSRFFSSAFFLLTPRKASMPFFKLACVWLYPINCVASPTPICFLVCSSFLSFSSRFSLASLRRFSASRSRAARCSSS